MKKFLFSLVLIVACFVTQIQAQFDSGYPKLVRGNGYWELQIEATLDSTAASTTAPDSIATGWYEIADFDYTNEYAQFFYKFTTNGASATDTAFVSVDVWGNETASFTNADNIVQLVDTTNSETSNYAASTMNNIRPKYINIVFEQNSTVAGGGVDDSVDVTAVFRLPVKEPKIGDE